MGAVAVEGTQDQAVARVRVTLLAPFAITFGDRRAEPWYRPSAKRLCELLMLSPGLALGREMARETLFPNLAPARSANALSRAITHSRDALSALGEDGRRLVRADRARIWVAPDVPVEIDYVAHQAALRSALRLAPGAERDEAFSTALLQGSALLEDEPYAEWALRPREALELLRQKARLELARDRARGQGLSWPQAVIEGWEACLAHDPASEEVASALMRLYAARGARQLACNTYEQCRAALEELGLRASPALEETLRATVEASPLRARGTVALATERSAPSLGGEERRLVSVLFAELSGPVRAGRWLDPEEMRLVVGEALAGVIAEVEALGGTVASVSGGGLQALFGAPEAHEDDPERAVRAGFRIMQVPGTIADSSKLCVRVGIETGPAVVGPLGTRVEYAAVGEVIRAAAALQSAAKAGAVLVGPVTRAAVTGVFEWGLSEQVAVVPGAQPLVASYLERPRARASGYRGQASPARHAPLVGREVELSVLGQALREATSGSGSMALVVGDPGLGKTRLVQECRKRFMAWVGAGTGRLPLWLEGRCTSYASSTPYGLYQQLLSAWAGVVPEEGEQVVRPALQRALKAIFGGQDESFPLLAHMMGVPGGQKETQLARLGPEGLQRATFGAVRGLIARLVSRGPTVLVLEDLHWADPTSLRLTETVAALAERDPLFLLMTRRPEPDPGVSGLEAALGAVVNCHLRKLELSPLTEVAERELARSLMGGDAGDEVVEGVCAGVDGNPLFLEQRFSSLIETGALAKDDTAWHLAGTEGAEVPAVLERLIRSRVDRLAPRQRQAIVAASVLGTQFTLSALGALTDASEQLPAAVAELCASGLINEVRRLPEPVYRFRHALIQEVTYRGMLRAQRRQLHGRAAWGLEATSADRLDEVAAVLGHHYAAAGEAERAIRFLEVAGDHAVSVCANDEAISLYHAALAVVGAGRPSDELMVKAAVQLRFKLAYVLFHRSMGGKCEGREVLREAIGLAEEHDSFEAARLLNLLGRFEIENHDYAAALAAFAAADAWLGDRPQDQDQAVVALWLEIQLEGRGLVYFFGNEPEKGAAVLAEVGPVVQARGGPDKGCTSTLRCFATGFPRHATASTRR